ncbi:MAG: tRNA (adenosine(37)-N6)-threonylcarbamoyltransferase complex transferase subunit TsaD, partial [Alphaproteobacteria bacterium]|nr:tRNA (adenosine(37)-N6)-threonylcarbamoyltransferase complex transferase subunit TsaD [Alphaproteobacteria bacterium]
ESSCDETAVAIIKGRTILSHKIFSQIDTHALYGGVVPEIAARAHAEKVDPLVAECLKEAKLKLKHIDVISAGQGPGLIGGVAVGLTYAKALAFALDKPFVAVNHLEAHALIPRIMDEIPFPHLVFLASGGHTQFVLINGIGDYKIIGTSLDDALGEAFDKTAKLLDLPYPGGPYVDNLAKKGRATIDLPRPLKGTPEPNFSFSGLKSAVRRIVKEKTQPYTKEDLCASFQEAVCDTVADRTKVVLKLVPQIHGLSFAGGVARNTALRATLKNICAENNVPFFVPDPALCVDNGVMIAWAGYERFRLGKTSSLDVAPYPRKNLEDVK